MGYAVRHGLGGNGGLGMHGSSCAWRAKLERLRIAVAPMGWDTNFTWLNPRSGNLDKRPALEFLVGIDRHTGAYIPELAEKWEMAPDGKTWTITLRQGVKFHDNWGSSRPKTSATRCSSITQPESVQSDASTWRTLMGVAKTDTIEDVAKKVEQGVEIIDDYKVVFRLKQAVPEFVETISANTDLVIESKARWDAGGKELYGQKVVGTGPFEFVERKVSAHVLYKRVENHWRKTPEYQRARVPLGAGGRDQAGRPCSADEVHISDVRPGLAEGRGGQGDAGPHEPTTTPSSTSGNLVGCTLPRPDKLDPNVPFVKKAVRQAMNLAINRQAIAEKPPGWSGGSRIGCMGTIPSWTVTSGRGSGTRTGTSALRSSTAMTRPRPRRFWSRRGIPMGLSSRLYLYTLPGLPEMVDIGQAMALDWQAIGLKPKLVEIELLQGAGEVPDQDDPRGCCFPRATPCAPWMLIRLVHKAKDSTGYCYEHPFIEERLEALGKVVDPAERARLLREIGDHKFTEFAGDTAVLAVRGSDCEPQVCRGVCVPGGDHRLLYTPGVRQAGAVKEITMQRCGRREDSLGSGGRYRVDGHGGLGANGCSCLRRRSWSGSESPWHPWVMTPTFPGCIPSVACLISGRPWSTLVGIDRNTGSVHSRAGREVGDGARWQDLDHHVTQGRQIPRELGRVHRQRRAPCGLPHHPA